MTRAASTEAITDQTSEQRETKTKEQPEVAESATSLLARAIGEYLNNCAQPNEASKFVFEFDECGSSSWTLERISGIRAHGARLKSDLAAANNSLPQLISIPRERYSSYTLRNPNSLPMGVLRFVHQ